MSMYHRGYVLMEQVDPADDRPWWVMSRYTDENHGGLCLRSTFGPFATREEAADWMAEAIAGNG